MPRVHDQLHRTGVDNAVVHFDPTFVFLSDVPPRLKEDPGQGFEDVRLVDDRYFLAAVLQRVVESKADDPLTLFTCVDALRDGHRMRIIADRDKVLESDVEAFEVLAHEHDVDVLIAPARDHGASRPQIGVEAERLTQAHVHGAEAAPDRSGQRPLERELGSLDAVQRRLRERVAASLDGRHSADLLIPLEWSAEGTQNFNNSTCDLRANLVAGDECCGNRLLSVHELRPSSVSGQNRSSRFKLRVGAGRSEGCRRCGNTRSRRAYRSGTRAEPPAPSGPRACSRPSAADAAGGGPPARGS